MAFLVRIISKFLQHLEAILIKASKISHRAIGPIFVEWIFLRVPAGALALLRLLLRSISYASVQRVIATSIALIVLIIFYFLRT